MMSIQQLIPQIEQQTGQALTDCHITSLSGGDINAAYQLKTRDFSWFVKVNRPTLVQMFAAEAEGLKELAATRTIRIPGVITHGAHSDYSFLVLEYIPLTRMSKLCASELGHQLAALHRQPQPFFGWHIDNTIGSTEQLNNRHDDWVVFWQQQRLRKQLELAGNKGYRGKLQNQGEKLAAHLAVFFHTYHPQASLLHGDLWGGNAAADEHGQPVIYDPACYYGDREADIAMTELFGGFGSNFFAAYQESWPLDSGYQTRKNLYNLYHILNHLNLFGSSYQYQAESMISSLLAEI